MAEQQKKKKRNVSDYAGIASILSFCMPVLWMIFMETGEYISRLAGHQGIFEYIGNGLVLLSILFLVIWIIAVPFSFVAGIIGLIKYSGKKAENQGHFSPWWGIFTGGLFALLIGLAIPNYLEFPARAKQSEAKENLRAIYTAYQSYFSDYHTYPSLPSIQIGNTTANCFSIVGWAPKGQIRYNYNCMNNEIFRPEDYHQEYPCPEGIMTSANQNSFTVAACGNVDNVSTVDVWTINDVKKLKNVIDDVRK